MGAAVGCALLSKYSALFFGPAILIWLLVAPKPRRWLLTPWPYLGGCLAFALFAPVIVWNAEHHWVSFLKQISGRARVEDFRLTYLLELMPAQIAFATPLVFILGAMGLHALARFKTGAQSARVLVNAMFWTITAYFVWHSLHARVEANWFAPIYPAFMVAAAVAAHLVRWEGGLQRVADVLSALGRADRHRHVRAADHAGRHRMALVLSSRRHRAQCRGRLARLGRRNRSDPQPHRRDMRARARLRHHQLARVLSAAGNLRRAAKPAHPLGHMREPDAAQLAGPLLYVDEIKPRAQLFFKEMFGAVEEVAELPRRRGPLTIETYTITLLSRPNGDVFDRSPPPELLR